MPLPDRPVTRVNYDGAWLGLIARDVIQYGAKCYVLIPSFDEEHQFGPCRWMSRDDVNKPAKGDRCLVVFDEHRNPWVIAWWPFDE
jgi:hypothetical protein